MINFVQKFSTNEACLNHLAKTRWPNGVTCPRCGHKVIYRFADLLRYKCKSCRYIFNAKNGTIFHNSKVPLPKWFLAGFLLTSMKKGISSPQLARYIKVTQKTAWNMLHAIRSVFTQEDILSGVVEIDETFVGGKFSNMHAKDRPAHGHGRSMIQKAGVLGMLGRGEQSSVRAMHVTNLRTLTIEEIVKRHIDEGSLVITDEYRVYPAVLRDYNHVSCNHAQGKYVVDGYIHTNSLEGFWSHLKRMILGCYHWVSKKYLQLYLQESCFRFNTRFLLDMERFDKVLGVV